MAEYLAATFGPDSSTPHSPAQLPEWEKVKVDHGYFSDEALDIVYVDYELTGDRKDRPGSARQDKDGFMWLEMNAGLSRLDPASGEIKTWRLPNRAMSFIHEILPVNDGTVWLTLEAQGGLAVQAVQVVKHGLQVVAHGTPRRQTMKKAVSPL